jgi:chemotaxis protein methyltransferase CheR
MLYASVNRAKDGLVTRDDTKDDCVEFLHWALPRLRMRWAGYRKVRRQVCRRLRSRVAELGLADLAAYRDRLEADADEWATLDALTRITISRFRRDHAVFELIEEQVLPELARQRSTLSAWSVGCASGEEPYTLAIGWNLKLAHRLPGATLAVLATDVDPQLLRRAARACYPISSLRVLPESWRAAAFDERDGQWCVRDEHRRLVRLRPHDVRDAPPNGPFDLVLCRNLAFTYFDTDLQREVADQLATCLRPGGALVVGTHERVPDGVTTLAPWLRCVYRHRI